MWRLLLLPLVGACRSVASSEPSTPPHRGLPTVVLAVRGEPLLQLAELARALTDAKWWPAAGSCVMPGPPALGNEELVVPLVHIDVRADDRAIQIWMEGDPREVERLRARLVEANEVMSR